MNSKQIRKKMIDLDLSQTELAEILGISKSRVNDALSGRREGRSYFKKIVDYLRNQNK